ncbi:hypothetical protein GOP47_0000385 [Adiantum capillus-veneris]|uniref:Annexin n=1 Tax=Adiantum capillus-veneris TaxID=13818 RepID=A0A9D4VEM2_ADICA|nr:hypothetical protein GOP47_0000385 [Adiantum capillus-veneris]
MSSSPQLVLTAYITTGHKDHIITIDPHVIKAPLQRRCLLSSLIADGWPKLGANICLPPMVPNPNLDCLDLHRAFKGLGCDAEEVIRILAHRNASERAQIRMVYKNMFEEDICKRLKRELHYHFEKAMLMWMREAPDRDVRISDPC